MPSAQARRAKAPENDDATHSGRLLLRMPPALHADLARAAEREGVSLNAYITRVLSGEKIEPGSERGRTLIRAAVIADLVLVAIAATVAIALLVVAWP
jgi:hypothetical protein